MIRMVHRIRTLTGYQWAALATFAIGTILDLFYHAAPAAWLSTIDQYLGPDGSRAHLITFVGMVLILGIVLDAAFTPRLASPERKGGGAPRTNGQPTDDR